jgi:PTH1 family peptidyl-tRNA hydrolase
MKKSMWERLFQKKKAEDVFLVVGLGNPGIQYEKSYHNMGFWAVDTLAQTLDVRFREHNRLEAEVASARRGSKSVMISKPTTYMNRSGRAVSALLAYYRVPLENLVVIYDDIDLNRGALRIRPNGGPGTHNGMRSIINTVRDEGFARIRVGVGKPEHPGMDLADYVLSKAAPEMKQTCKNAAAAALCFVEKGIEDAMRCYNSKG